MSERDWPKELEEARQWARKVEEQCQRMQQAVRIAAKSQGLTEADLNNLIAMALRGPS